MKSQSFVHFGWPRLLLVLPALACLLAGGAGTMRGQTFSNTTPIFLNPPPGPYPSSLTVSGTTGVVAGVTVSLLGVTHVFPDDLDILLYGPGGQKVMLMSDAGGGNSISGVNLTFSPSASATLPNSTLITNGAYLPTDYAAGETLPVPAPAGPYGTSLNVFTGANPTGTWRLYASDDSSANGGGAINGGWRLTLSMSVPPVVSLSPTNLSVPPGSVVTFGATVSGTPPFGYQWLRNGQVLVPFGQGAAVLTVSNVQAANAGFYSVVVTNLASPAGVVSSEATLNVLGPLTLVETPQDAEVEPGKAVQFRVIATGTPPFFYQWRLNDELLPGETNSILTLINLQPTNGGSYSVTAWQPADAVTTLPAKLRVTAGSGPAGADDFADRILVNERTDRSGVLQGDSSAATSQPGEPVTPGGGKTVWHEWLAPVDGIVTLTLRGSGFDTLLGVFTGTSVSNLTLVTKDDDLGGFFTSAVRFNVTSGTYYQWMIDGFGLAGVGGDYTLSWALQDTSVVVPVIVSQPEPVAVMNGSNATFSVLSDTPGVAYQWYFNGASIGGATSSVYTVEQASAADVGAYTVRLQTSAGDAIQSAPAVLQLGWTAGALMHDKMFMLYQSSANGNRPAAGFISIGLGGADYLQATVTNTGALSTPCDQPISIKYRYRGLLATNTGSIKVISDGSAIFCRMAVYLDPVGPASVPLACDTGSAPAMQPAELMFAASNGVKYIVVTEAYQSTGIVDVTSLMGLAPPIPESPQFHLVPPGASFLLSMPATNWVPVPACRWRLNGQPITGATNTTLLLTNFSLSNTGAYSVVMSNLIGLATNTVALLGLAQAPYLQPARVMSGGNPAFAITITNAAPLVLQTATNLNAGQPWISLTTNPASGVTFAYTNAGLLAEPRRFFRAILWSPFGP